MNKIFVLRLLAIIFYFNISTSFSATPLVGFNAIYNGDKVTSEVQFPFVVPIYHILSQNDNGYDINGLCTGSIIGKNWILTAGHCVRTPFDPASATSETLMSPDTLLVGIGSLDLKKAKVENFIHVKQIFAFSDKNDMDHDIALLQLVDAINIQQVSLTSYNDFPNLKTSQLPATAVGYGWIDKRMPGVPMPVAEENDFYSPLADGAIAHIDGYLHYGDEIIQDDQAIEAFLAKGSVEAANSSGIDDDVIKHQLEDDIAAMFNPITMLSVTSPDGKRMTNGDSGGPLLLTITQKDNSKRYVQIGVASMTPLSSASSSQECYSVYANLTNRDMLNFINDTMKNNP